MNFFDFQANYPQRLSALRRELLATNCAALLLVDREGQRDQSLAWLCGQPGDAGLLVTQELALLLAWDTTMAAEYARGVSFSTYAQPDRLSTRALVHLVREAGLAKGSRLEVPGSTTFLEMETFRETLVDVELFCRNKGAHEKLSGLRSIKDKDEIALYRKISQCTDELADEIRKGLSAGRLKSEIDIALFIEQSSREAGCEGTGFTSLVAGPQRSWTIHAHPPYTAGSFAKEGFSILDFGLKARGYTSDVSLSFVKGRLTKNQSEMLDLVRKAYEEAVSLLRPNQSCLHMAQSLAGIFAAANRHLSHGLGHGIGLEPHEAPRISVREDCTDLLAPGMIVTLEPGLYDRAAGGLRLENDFLITETGYEVLTHADIVEI